MKNALFFIAGLAIAAGVAIFIVRVDCSVLDKQWKYNMTFDNVRLRNPGNPAEFEDALKHASLKWNSNVVLSLPSGSSPIPDYKKDPPPESPLTYKVTITQCKSFVAPANMHVTQTIRLNTTDDLKTVLDALEH